MKKNVEKAPNLEELRAERDAAIANLEAAEADMRERADALASTRRAVAKVQATDQEGLDITLAEIAAVEAGDRHLAAVRALSIAQDALDVAEGDPDAVACDAATTYREITRNEEAKARLRAELAAVEAADRQGAAVIGEAWSRWAQRRHAQGLPPPVRPVPSTDPLGLPIPTPKYIEALQQRMASGPTPPSPSPTLPLLRDRETEQRAKLEYVHREEAKEAARLAKERADDAAWKAGEAERVRRENARDLVQGEKTRELAEAHRSRSGATT